MAATKIAVYSLPDLKNTTDDALPNYLKSLKFKQSHFLTDVRLSLGYAAVIVAAVTFYFDYKLGWDSTKTWTLWAVVAYFLLNGALTYWIWGVERGTVFSSDSLSVASSVRKHTPMYNLTVRHSTLQGDWKTIDLSAPFTRWFDADGYFVAKPFQQWLSSKIPIIGQADPQNAVEGKRAATPTMTETEKNRITVLQTPSGGAKEVTKSPGLEAGPKSRRSKRHV